MVVNDEYTHMEENQGESLRLTLDVGIPRGHLTSSQKRVDLPDQARRPVTYSTWKRPWSADHYPMDPRKTGKYKYQASISVHFHEPQCPVALTGEGHRGELIPFHKPIPRWVPGCFSLPYLTSYKCICEECLFLNGTTSVKGKSSNLWVFVVSPLCTTDNLARQIVKWLCVERPMSCLYTPNTGPGRLVPAWNDGEPLYQHLFHYLHAQDPLFYKRLVYYLPLMVEFRDNLKDLDELGWAAHYDKLTEAPP